MSMEEQYMEYQKKKVRFGQDTKQEKDDVVEMIDTSSNKRTVIASTASGTNGGP
jgi:hypothetical protein